MSFGLVEVGYFQAVWDCVYNLEGLPGWWVWLWDGLGYLD